MVLISKYTIDLWLSLAAFTTGGALALIVYAWVKARDGAKAFDRGWQAGFKTGKSWDKGEIPNDNNS